MKLLIKIKLNFGENLYESIFKQYFINNCIKLPNHMSVEFQPLVALLPPLLWRNVHPAWQPYGFLFGVGVHHLPNNNPVVSTVNVATSRTCICGVVGYNWMGVHFHFLGWWYNITRPLKIVWFVSEQRFFWIHTSWFVAWHRSVTLVIQQRTS